MAPSIANKELGINENDLSIIALPLDRDGS